MSKEEEYALAEEQKQLAWEAKFTIREKRDYQLLNQLLAQQDYAGILQLYKVKRYGEFYSGRNAFVSMNLAMKIYEHDMSAENHIFWDVKSIDLLETKLQKLKFLIWRAEYFGCDEIEEQLLTYMIEHRPSDWMLKYLICATVQDEKMVMLGFAKLFLKWNMPEYAKNLVSYLEKK